MRRLMRGHSLCLRLLNDSARGGSKWLSTYSVASHSWSVDSPASLTRGLSLGSNELLNMTLPTKAPNPFAIRTCVLRHSIYQSVREKLWKTCRRIGSVTSRLTPMSSSAANAMSPALEASPLVAAPETARWNRRKCFKSVFMYSTPCIFLDQSPSDRICRMTSKKKFLIGAHPFFNTNIATAAIASIISDCTASIPDSSASHRLRRSLCFVRAFILNSIPSEVSCVRDVDIAEE